jgi:lipopolysaccharide export system permease protein
MLRLKKIDLLLLRSFVGPFFVAFGVALFVLVMQFFWLYIDEIAGKGVSLLVLLEMVGYFSVSMFPLALPIAILISSVMVLGDLAEMYELSSIKSAGVSLLRVLRPLMLVSIGIGIFSYVCSDFLIPKANLAFKSRLHDVRRTKPTLTLETGIFNEDFKNFVIRIGKKGNDGETIGQVQINDLTNSSLSINKILADSGAMYTSNDKKYFVMELHQGAQYQQPNIRSAEPEKKYTFIRTNFKSWTKLWDMSEFEMTRSDEDRISTQRSMLSMDQLRAQIDSLVRQERAMNLSVGDDLTNQFNRLTIEKNKKLPSTAVYKLDTSVLKTVSAPPIKATKKSKRDRLQSDSSVINLGLAPNSTVRFPAQIDLNKTILVENESLLELFAEGERKVLAGNAAATLKGQIGSLGTRKQQINDRRKERVKTAYELYSKYGFALVCIVFLFIGAPMGSIIRKGGFGWPVLVAIIFFVVFIFLTIMCRELAEIFVLHPFMAAMVPCLVLMPIAALLTYRSMRDMTMGNTLLPNMSTIIHIFRKKSPKHVA